MKKQDLTEKRKWEEGNQIGESDIIYQESNEI